MPLEIEGEVYATTADVVDTIGVSRQTLWRWRRSGKVPIGRRFRDGQIIFNKGELADIRRYANRLMPVRTRSEKSAGFQMNLFD